MIIGNSFKTKIKSIQLTVLHCAAYCVGIWSRRIILDVLPSEAKEIRQKAGRLSRIEHRSAAFYAAQQMYIAKKEIQINTNGKCIATYANQGNNKSNIGEKNRYNEELKHNDNIAFEFSLPRGQHITKQHDTCT